MECRNMVSYNTILIVVLSLCCVSLWVLLLRWSFIVGRLVRHTKDLTTEILRLVKALDEHDKAMEKKQDIIEK